MSQTDAKNIIQISHKNAKHHEGSVHPELLAAFTHIFNYLSRDNDLTESDAANYADTPVRAAKAFADLTRTRTQIYEELRHILETGFPREHSMSHPGPPTQGPIMLTSLCPHHLLKVEYECYVSYLPKKDGNVLGLSKMARIATTLAKRPVLQEQLACDIADTLHGGNPHINLPGIESDGSAVLLIGAHSCMSCRGVVSNAITSVSEIRGAFRADGMEAKFFQAVDNLVHSRLRR